MGGYYSINYVKKNQSSTSEFNPAFNEMITGSKLISENLNSPLKLYPIVKKTPSFHINTEKNEKPEQPVDKIEPDPDIPDSITINSEPPNIYGTIIVPSDTTLFRMIDRVYGDFNPELLNKVLEYNSIISKPDKLLSGIPVRFPVPDKKLKYSDQTIFLLILQTYDFNQAFTKAMLPKYKDLDVRIISFWCQGKGYLFNVVIDRPFTNKENSLIFQKKIKPIIATVPKSVVSLKSIIYDLIEKR